MTDPEKMPCPACGTSVVAMDLPEANRLPYYRGRRAGSLYYVIPAVETDVEMVFICPVCADNVMSDGSLIC